MLKPCFYLLFLLTVSNTIFGQQSLNVDLLGQFHRGDARYSGSWAYTNGAGNEYALLGTRTGVAAYPIDDPENIFEAGFIPGPESNWREITVIGDFAYVTTEGTSAGTGMQVIDLQYLPDSLHLLTTYTETFTNGHILQRDIYSDSAYVYVMGGNSLTEGVHIMDVSDPANPLEIGLYDPGYYIHDCHVKYDLMFACAFFESRVDIVDISDKSNPVLIAQIDDPTGRTHSAWLTEDDRYLVVCSEEDGLPARIYNVEDFNNITEVAQYTANALSLVHNPYIRGKFVFFSHNTEGLRVVDIADPKLPVEVGYYDTFDGPSGGFSGLWSACPFYPSGKIIGGNREDGLYVWSFNNTEAGRFYGRVIDSLSGETLTDVEILLVENSETLSQDAEGVFRYGDLPGSYTLSFFKEGYFPKNENIVFQGGDSLSLLIELVPDLPIGVGERPEKIPHFKVSPNPMALASRVDLSGFESAGELKLFSMQGQLLRSYSVAGSDHLLIEKGDFAVGTYLLQLTNHQNEIIGISKLMIE